MTGLELDKIYNMDCIEGMMLIPDSSIDCIICDLPYGVLNKRSESARWDSVIPIDKLWEQYLRIAKDNAPIILFGQGMFTAKLMMSNPSIWRYNLIWDKVGSTGFLDASRKPMRQHEDIAVFYRKQPTYNPQFTGEKKEYKSKQYRKKNRCYGEIKYEHVRTSGRVYPDSIIRVSKYSDRCRFHPTQKPVDLIRYLIRTYSNEGDTILDNCIGSGTTAIACIKEKRHFIGFEKDDEYFQKAEERIRMEQSQLSIF